MAWRLSPRFPAMADDRFNLWLTIGDHSKIICYGSRSDMNILALSAGIGGDVHVLPDGTEPCDIIHQAQT